MRPAAASGASGSEPATQLSIFHLVDHVMNCTSADDGMKVNVAEVVATLNELHVHSLEEFGCVLTSDGDSKGEALRTALVHACGGTQTFLSALMKAYFEYLQVGMQRGATALGPVDHGSAVGDHMGVDGRTANVLPQAARTTMCDRERGCTRPTAFCMSSPNASSTPIMPDDVYWELRTQRRSGAKSRVPPRVSQRQLRAMHLRYVIRPSDFSNRMEHLWRPRECGRRSRTTHRGHPIACT